MPLKKAEHAAVLLQEVPIEPRGLVILIPRIVVAALGIHKLVARSEHRSSIGKHQDGEEILDLSRP